MRVIAGSAKGRPLHAPRGQAVRPTSDKIKGSIYSMLESMLVARLPESEEGYAQAQIWEDKRVLDLYAGTGALAIEALSRGAAFASLVEASQAACRIIRRNLKETGLEAKAHLHCVTVQSALREDSVLRTEGSYDIITLDPPYADPALAGVVEAVAASALVHQNTLVVVEHSRRVALEDEYEGLARIRERTHGDTTVSIYVNQERTD
ncbi:MAG: RsmD family RNA methyltransferase [Chloroflexota bacterium]